ncbi:enoyl-CoA hydratase/isomerase family protein [Nocardia sp. NPDC051570]|uniref:enoyl-CoA hydratase/isomerase family protein n=1 Tax=Nocardia sp. NPDC051570 TaxID=3364324 RepID=UPI003788CFE0
MTTSTHRTVTIHPHAGGWAALRLDNPPLNLLDQHVYRELVDALERLAADPRTKVVVLESADPEFFSAHFDMSLTTEAMAEASALYPRLIKALQSPELVSIAKVRGRARGGGDELILLCDMRFASIDNSFFAQPEVGSGLIPGGGALQLLPALIGRGRALELMLSGRNIDGATAERYGVVNRALPDDELDDYVDSLAAHIASRSGAALAAVKKAVDRRNLPADADFRTDTEDFTRLYATAEVRAATAAALAAGLQTRGPLEYNLGD